MIETVVNILNQGIWISAIGVVVVTVLAWLGWTYECNRQERWDRQQ